MLLVSLWKAVILGIIKGITEWLPISGTERLILVGEFIKLDLSEDSMGMFNVVTQLGAIMAVVILYFHELNPFPSKKNGKEEKDAWILWSKVLITCLPTAVTDLKFDDYLGTHPYNFLTISIILIVYGIAFITIGKRNENIAPRCTNLKDFTYKVALTTGALQVLALIPETSRSGVTILGAVLIGASRFVAAEFSFFLGIPVMFRASFSEIFKFLAKGNTFGPEEIIILVTGSIIAFVVSIVVVELLLNYLKKNDSTVFGWYRIILGAILIGCWLFS